MSKRIAEYNVESDVKRSIKVLLSDRIETHTSYEPNVCRASDEKVTR